MNRVIFFKKIGKYCAKLGLGRSQKIVNIYEEMMSKIGSSIRTEYVEIEGQKIFLDKEDSLMLSTKNDKYEQLEIDCFKQIIKRGDTVIDLGANIGLHTLLFAKLVGEFGHVFAFEPDTGNFEILSKNVKENKHENVTLVQKAVSDKNGKIKLFVSKRNNASHRIYDSEEKRESVEISVTTLDSYFEEYEKPIKFIKMDVEGAEGTTLLGASKILDNSKNLIIMMEYFPKWIKKSGIIPEDILKLLVKKNFKLMDIDKINRKIEPVILKNFVEKYNEQKKNYTNILCKKGEENLTLNL